MPPEFVTILGVRFFNGSVEDAVERMEQGGLLVVPAAPALKDIDRNAGYREALLNADLCITDSAFMVLIWNRISKQKIHRLSGLKYLRELLQREDGHRPGNVVWIMAIAYACTGAVRQAIDYYRAASAWFGGSAETRAAAHRALARLRADK